MDTFTLGNKGEAVIKMGLEKVYRVVRETPKEIETQMKWADIVLGGNRSIGIATQKIEVKTEWKHTGNFFLETVSNAETGRQGWMKTSTADDLYYLFWEQAIGYRLQNFQHFKFIFDYYKQDFPEVEQKKNQQINLTKGRLVPVEWVGQCWTGLHKFEFAEEKESIERGIAS